MFAKMKSISAAICRCIKSNLGHIAYYSMVALALALIAWAAQDFRPEEVHAVQQQAMPAAAEEVRTYIPLFEMPDASAIVQQYSSVPMWDHYMKCWHTHTAVDYTCTDGKVLSLSEGTIESVGEDGVLGGFVEIKTDAFMLKYASVEPGTELKDGMQIKKGEPIGFTAANMAAEAHLGNHVHLEVRNHDNKPIDIFELKNKMQLAGD